MKQAQADIPTSPKSPSNEDQAISDELESENAIISRLRERTSFKRKNKKGKKATKIKSNGIYQSSLWNINENESYMHFLIENEELFYTSKENRKSIKLNVLMEKAVKTRSADQCRSHHQKMIKYHHDIPNIIRHIKNIMKQSSAAETSLPTKIVIQKDQASSSKDESSEMHQREESFEPLYDWQYWTDFNKIAEEERIIRQWFQGVEDKYGNL